MLLRPRWIAGHVTVLVLAAIFVALGFWQLARNHQKQQKVRAERLAYDAPAPDLITTPGLGDGDRTQAEGSYDLSHQFLLRNQVLGGNVGDDLLTPMRLRDGTAVIVNRGWLQLDNAEQEPLPAPPAGPIVVRGLVHPARTLSAQDSASTTNGVLSLPRVDVGRIGAAIPYPVRSNWIEMQAQEPPPGPGAPQLPQPPPPDPVNHMQYAIEWFAFALIPLIGWPIVLVRIARRQQPEREPASA